jgi:hypothetical protein
MTAEFVTLNFGTVNGSIKAVDGNQHSLPLSGGEGVIAQLSLIEYDAGLAGGSQFWIFASSATRHGVDRGKITHKARNRNRTFILISS